jgi:alpha-D-ribose 1-methylphosphonate 5-triphosphate synthase subunit PhnH
VNAAAGIAGGLADPARDGARAFRAVLDAMARPGRIVTVTGAAAPGLSPAAATVLATLCDADTPVHLAVAEAGRWLAFHCGAPLAEKAGCAFAVGPWGALAPLDPYPAGTPDYPDRSATLIVEMPDLSDDGPPLTGPGIAGTARLSLPDPDALRANAARFPLGLDLILCAGDRLACLPRSTRIGGA